MTLINKSVIILLKKKNKSLHKIMFERVNTMKVCKKCKKQVANKSKVCKYCGSDVSKIKPPPTNKNNKQQPKKTNEINEVKKEELIEVKEVETKEEKQEIVITNDKKDFKYILNIIKKYILVALKFLKKWIGIVIKYIIKYSKIIYQKIIIGLKIIYKYLKILLKKIYLFLKKVVKKIKQEYKKNEAKATEIIKSKRQVLIDKKLSSGIPLNIVTEKQNLKKQEPSYETTVGLPIITDLEKEESISERLDKEVTINFTKIFKSIGNFFYLIFKKIKLVFYKIKYKIRKRQEEKIKKEHEEKTKPKEIKQEEKEEYKEISHEEEDEYEGYSIKKIIIFLILVACIVLGIIYGIRFIADNMNQDEVNIITEKTKKKVYQMNENISYNGMNYKITKTYVSKGTKYKKPKEGNRFVVVMFEYKNNSKKVQKYSYESWKIENSKKEESGRIFTPVNVNTALYSGNLVVGATKKGSLVFETPEDEDELTLNFYNERQIDQIKKELEQQQKIKEEKEKNGEEYKETKITKQTPVFKVKIKVNDSKDYNEQEDNK